MTTTAHLLHSENVHGVSAAMDPVTGQFLSVEDEELGFCPLTFLPGPEFEINRQGMAMTIGDVFNSPMNCQTTHWMEAITSMASGYRLRLLRNIVFGGAQCPHSGVIVRNRHSLHIRYRVDRFPFEKNPTTCIVGPGPVPVEAPLYCETLGGLAAHSEWFGPHTHLKTVHCAGSGPREHVSIENGPITNVIPYLQNFFKRSGIGVQTIPGAVYYDPETWQWTWVTCRRPNVGFVVDFRGNSQPFQFLYHTFLNPGDSINLPEVSVYWGVGQDALYQTWADSLDVYEEPPEYFDRTAWFWFGFWADRPDGFAGIARQVEILAKGGIKGFGLTVHDLRPGATDCACASLRPSPLLGGEPGLRCITRTIREHGGYSYVWLPVMGLAAGGDIKSDWLIKGMNGRAYGSYAAGGLDEMYIACNFAHPDFQAYYLEWIRHYIEDIEVDGIFFDCGGSPLPCDFSPKASRPFLDYPSQSQVAVARFFERVIQLGTSLTNRFFLWIEGASLDIPCMGWATDTGTLEFDRFAHRGRKRLVWSIGTGYSLAGGFPRISPTHDNWGPVSLHACKDDDYRRIADDPMNRWFCEFVKTHPARHARALAGQAAYLNGHLVTEAGDARAVLLPRAYGRGVLVDVLTGERYVSTAEDDEGGQYRLPGGCGFMVQDA